MRTACIHGWLLPDIRHCVVAGPIKLFGEFGCIYSSFHFSFLLLSIIRVFSYNNCQWEQLSLGWFYQIRGENIGIEDLSFKRYLLRGGRAVRTKKSIFLLFARYVVRVSVNHCLFFARCCLAVLLIEYPLSRYSFNILFAQHLKGLHFYYWHDILRIKSHQDYISWFYRFCRPQQLVPKWNILNFLPIHCCWRYFSDVW